VEHVYGARGAASRLWGTRAREVVLSGPAGTGKSRAALEKLHAAMLKYPGSRALICRKTQTSLGSTALVTWREQVVPEAIAAGIVRFYGGSPEEPAAYRYANGSTIVLGGMDKATKIMSSEYDMIFVQECIELTVDDWEALLTRLRNGRMPYQQIIGDTNPAQPTHWLKLRANSGTTVMYESRHEDNPAMVHADGTYTERGAAYLATLDQLSGVRHKRLRLGLWVAAEGLVYEDWDPHVHVVPWFNPPKAWTRWWTVDFGYNHALVIQCWAEDEEGRLFLYRELFRRRMLVQDAATRMLDEVAPQDPETGERVWREPRPTAVYTDHDREDRATFERYIGFSTDMAHKAVDDGLQAVAVRLKLRGDGKPGIFLMADAVLDGRQKDIVESGQPASTVEEFAGYVWDTRGGKRITEQPIKIFDDGLDALRYMVAARDLQGRPGFRWMDTA
jgi:hypothetical protein